MGTPPGSTALGAMMGHVHGSGSGEFQPQNVNFGLFPPLQQRVKKRERKAAYAARAREDFAEWLEGLAVQPLAMGMGKNV